MAASHQVLETTMLEMDLNKVVVETFSDENKKAMCIQKVLYELYEVHLLWASSVRNFSGFAQLSHQFLMILDPLHGRGRFGQVLGSYLDKSLLTYRSNRLRM